MTPLSDALTAAQRAALAALEKAYVAGQIDHETMSDRLIGCGITDTVDIDFLIVSLNVLREWGVAAPTMSERVARENGSEPMSDKQRDYIMRLFGEGKHRGEMPLDPADFAGLTKAQASELIGSLQRGTYDPEKWRVPF